MVLRALLLLLASWVARLAAVDYEALRVEARNLFASKIEEVRGSIATMQKAQRAAEQALDMCVLPTRSCVPSFLLPARRRGAGMSLRRACSCVSLRLRVLFWCAALLVARLAPMRVSCFVGALGSPAPAKNPRARGHLRGVATRFPGPAVRHDEVSVGFVFGALRV